MDSRGFDAWSRELLLLILETYMMSLHKVEGTGSYRIWGFPKIRGTFLGVAIIRIIVFWDYIGVSLFRETTISNTDRNRKP